MSLGGSSSAPRGIAWHDVRDWGVEGRGWSETERYFDRLPAHARGVVPDPVWERARFTSGVSARFETGATEIWVRWTLLEAGRSMPQTPATAVNGLDLYAADASGRPRWVAIGVAGDGVTTELAILPDIDPGVRAYTLYLPLFNGVDSVEIGVARDALFRPLSPRRERPVVVYGTSIVHGAGASRPGMTYVSILGRRLDRPMLNLGFSSQGKMHPEVVELLAELDPCVYVVDCLPNMEAGLVTERFESLVRRLRRDRPSAPIVVMEDRTYGGASLRPVLRARNIERRRALRAGYTRLVDAGIAGLHYVGGEALLGSDGEGTVDGSHPTDLGSVRIADTLEPVLRTALSGR